VFWSIAGRPQATKWRMRITRWMPKAMNTHREYLILTVFFFHHNDGCTNAPQYYVYTFVACLVKSTRFASVQFDFEAPGQRGLYFCSALGRCNFQVLSAWLYLSHLGFSQSILTDLQMVPQISHDRFLAYHLQLLIH
jgi:hypothetical protein